MINEDTDRNNFLQLWSNRNFLRSLIRDSLDNHSPMLARITIKARKFLDENQLLEFETMALDEAAKINDSSGNTYYLEISGAILNPFGSYDNKELPTPRFQMENSRFDQHWVDLNQFNGILPEKIREALIDIINGKISSLSTWNSSYGNQAAGLLSVYRQKPTPTEETDQMKKARILEKTHKEDKEWLMTRESFLMDSNNSNSVLEITQPIDVSFASTSVLSSVCSQAVDDLNQEFMMISALSASYPLANFKVVEAKNSKTEELTSKIYVNSSNGEILALNPIALLPSQVKIMVDVVKSTTFRNNLTPEVLSEEDRLVVPGAGKLSIH